MEGQYYTSYVCDVCERRLVPFEICGAKIWACPFCTNPLASNHKIRRKLKRGVTFFKTGRPLKSGEKYRGDGIRLGAKRAKHK